MVYKFIFSKPKNPIKIKDSQKLLNSYIHRCLGEDNKWHDSFSDYAISSLQGGKLINGYLTFENTNPYIIVSSGNPEFMEQLIVGIESGTKMCDMENVDAMEMVRYIGKDHDYVATISPILLKCEDKKITFDKPEWLGLLTENCRNKLEHCGIVDDTFKIVFDDEDRTKAKSKKIWVGDTYNYSSMVRFHVYGKRKTRETLYNMGFGCSTGSGFGSIRICE